MYAVIHTGGKQYRVAPGQKLKIEKLDLDAGSQVAFNQVLAIGSGDNLTLGQPLVADGQVMAEVLKHGRHDKVYIVKFRRRKHYRKQQGHRQHFTEVQITSIQGGPITTPLVAEPPVVVVDDAPMVVASPAANPEIVPQETFVNPEVVAANPDFAAAAPDVVVAEPVVNSDETPPQNGNPPTQPSNH